MVDELAPIDVVLWLRGSEAYELNTGESVPRVSSWGDPPPYQKKKTEAFMLLGVRNVWRNFDKDLNLKYSNINQAALLSKSS